MDYPMIAIDTLSWSMLAYLAIGHWSGSASRDGKATRRKKNGHHKMRSV